PAIHQGTSMHPPGGTAMKAAVIKHLTDPAATATAKRAQFDLIQRLNRATLEQVETDLRMEGMIQTMELAFQMHRAKPRSSATSPANPPPRSRAMASAAAPRITPGGNAARPPLSRSRRALRHHQSGQLGSSRRHRRAAPGERLAVDQPAAALLTDLKQRGLLEETLVMCMGEFGRTATF
ncbi:MAG: DUF1501 domain-containing protein, partial [Verrucomicrobiota bacterium]|nr:DUF1501 domain-containing protein [Verrucomicrobiota bacterium]